MPFLPAAKPPAAALGVGTEGGHSSLLAAGLCRGLGGFTSVMVQ